MHGSTGGSWKRSTSATDAEKNTQRQTKGHTGSATYRQELPPRQLPTLHGVCMVGFGQAVLDNVIDQVEQAGLDVLIHPRGDQAGSQSQRAFPACRCNATPARPPWRALARSPRSPPPARPRCPDRDPLLIRRFGVQDVDLMLLRPVMGLRRSQRFGSRSHQQASA